MNKRKVLATMRCTPPTSPLYATPDGEREMQTEVLFGERVEVFERYGDWLHICNTHDGYEGYVTATDFVESRDLPQPTHRISILWTQIYTRPGIKSGVIMTLPFGARIALGETIKQGMIQLKDKSGWLVLQHCVELREREHDLITSAIPFIGAPYLWGGKTGQGIDCSGLVQLACRRAGLKDCPRNSQDQAVKLGNVIEKNPDLRSLRLQKNDLVFWNDHVAIALDDEAIIHANSRAMAVSIDSLQDYALYKEKNGRKITSVRRITKGDSVLTSRGHHSGSAAA